MRDRPVLFTFLLIAGLLLLFAIAYLIAAPGLIL